MNLLKPLFFNKYKPRTTYQYNDDWKDVSLDRKTGRFSIKTRKTTHDPKGVVILAHPMKEMGKFYFIEYGHADLYVDLGYHVVVFDFNGFGESQDTKNFEFKYDVIDVIRVTRKLYPSFNPFLHGVSFGASQIILGCLSNETLVSGLIVESSVSSNIDYYKGRGSNLFYILNAYNAFFPGKNAHNIYTNMVKGIKHTPIVYIYGEQDVITPLWMGKALYQNTEVKDKELAVFDAHHLTTINDQPTAYRKVISDFLVRTTKKAP